MDGFVLHTVMGREGRCRKGREPERRLSETTGPQSPSAFRVVFPAPEVTDRVSGCKARGDIPHTTRIPEAVRSSHVPAMQEERRHMSPTAAGSGTHVPAPPEEERGALRAGPRARTSHVPGQHRRWM